MSVAVTIVATWQTSVCGISLLRAEGLPARIKVQTRKQPKLHQDQPYTAHGLPRTPASWIMSAGHSGRDTISQTLKPTSTSCALRQHRYVSRKPYTLAVPSLRQSRETLWLAGEHITRGSQAMHLYVRGCHNRSNLANKRVRHFLATGRRPASSHQGSDAKAAETTSRPTVHCRWAPKDTRILDHVCCPGHLGRDTISRTLKPTSLKHFLCSPSLSQSEST